MKKKNDFKRKNTLLSSDYKAKRPVSPPPPAGDVEADIRAVREAMRNLDSLPYERHQPQPSPSPARQKGPVPTGEELYRRIQRLERRLDALEDRVARNPYDIERNREYLPIFVGIFIFFILIVSSF